ncbi:MAG: hypothetical protein RSF90_04105 [Pygmaiobacter sp.]
MIGFVLPFVASTWYLMMCDLNIEHAELLAQKKKAYSEYAAAKKEMQEVTMSKANVDRLLGSQPAQP